MEINCNIKSFIKMKPVNPCKGQVPYGFYVNEFNELVQNPKEQAVIKLILQMQSNQESLTRIATRLNKDNVPAKNGGRWYANSVEKIVKNLSTPPCVDLNAKLSAEAHINKT